ncbi:MAG: hypothetical protein MH204_10205 [Fimbriimonadaceae bacterium]|nr:hypothetical protein [Fimbriimonadaceae bacterium]
MPSRSADRPGIALGLLTFLVGVGLILFAFWLTWQMVQTPPAEALGFEEGQPLDLNRLAVNGLGLLIRIILLVVMAGLGSMVASRGIRLYAGRAPAGPRERADHPAE